MLLVYLIFLLFFMSKSLENFIKNEAVPMQQATYWLLYICCGLIFVLKTVETASARSYEIIEILPKLADYSWLTNGGIF